MKLHSRHSLTIFVSSLALWLVTVGAVLADNLSVAIGGGDEVPVTRYAAKGDTLILWAPSSFGMQPPAHALAQELVFENLEVWLADLHEAFFVPQGRNSVDSFEPEKLVSLFDGALRTSGKKRLLLLTTGNGARPVLEAAHLWQRKHPGDPGLRGLILFHPSLYSGRPELGKEADYVPAVDKTNLPVFIIQPTLSTTHMRVTALQKRLQRAGSEVYLRIVEGARDGYHVRPEEDLSETDRTAKAGLATLIRQASQLLVNVPARAAAVTGDIEVKRASDAAPGLRPTHMRTTPMLSLPDMQDQLHRLEDYRGKVVLVSFWASWCPPCIKEMPSMNRLQRNLKNEAFVILGVNVGEQKSAIEQFLKQTEVRFPILRDQNRETYEAWKIYVVPSNFLVDARGVVRYGSVGAVEWDSPEITSIVKHIIFEGTTK
jgi:peroxiredoxin